jgi:hypothetical protein
MENILVIWNTLRPLGILGNFVVIWYIFPRFGILYQEKSGNPGTESFPIYRLFFRTILENVIFYL